MSDEEGNAGPTPDNHRFMLTDQFGPSARIVIVPTRLSRISKRSRAVPRLVERSANLHEGPHNPASALTGAKHSLALSPLLFFSLYLLCCTFVPLFPPFPSFSPFPLPAFLTPHDLVAAGPIHGPNDPTRIQSAFRAKCECARTHARTYACTRERIKRPERGARM